MIKIYDFFSDAPKLFHKAMVKANACLEEVNEKVHCFNFFQQSPYWAHSEAILLALLSDEDPDMRLWAVQKIIKIRQEKSAPSIYFKDAVRTWQKVTLLRNPLPEHYKDMIGKNQSRTIKLSLCKV